MPRASTRASHIRLLVLGAIGLSVVALALTASLQHATPAAAAPPCSPSLPHSSGTTFETIVSGSDTRQYYLQVPPSYDGVTPVPLVFLFHGRNWTPAQTAQIALFTKLNTKANAEGFILVYPLGLLGPGGVPWWNAVMDPGYANDVMFVDDMIDELESELCVDPQRIFSTGFSNGGILSVRLACSLSSRIAAIAPVVGVTYPPTSTIEWPSETCPDTRPVPMIGFVGTADTYLPFYGGASSTGFVGFRDIEAAVMPDWATHNGCSTTPVNSFPAPGVRLAENPGCAGGATTQLYVVYDADGPGPGTEGMGHHWPDSIIDPVAVFPQPSFGLNTHYISATNLMWDFFEAHPMAEASGGPVGGIVALQADDGVPAAAGPGDDATVPVGVYMAIGVLVLLGAGGLCAMAFRGRYR